MVAIRTESLQSVMAVCGGPCVTLLQPTHRSYPDSQQNRIRFSNLVRSLEESMKEKYPAREVRDFLQRFRELEGNQNFWTHQQDGLAIMADRDRFEVFRLPIPVQEMAVADETFHVKPLIRYLQATDRFHVLCFDRDKVSLYEGNRHGLEPVDLPGDFPAEIGDALGSEITEPHTTDASHTQPVGQPANPHSPHGETTVRHGHHSKKDEVQNDIVRFCNIIDKEVARRFSHPTKLPLVLVALPEYQTEFRKVSENPHLIPEGVAVGPNLMSADELLSRVWNVLKPSQERRITELNEGYGTARAKGLATKDPTELGQALARRRVGTLLIEEGRRIPGRFDPTTGNIALLDADDSSAPDLIDELAEETLRTGGDVVVLPADKMPTETGLAAIFRF